MIFLDTSICVAASYQAHPNHAECLRQLGWATDQGGWCAAHSMAELYSTLTRMPRPYRMSPGAALATVKRLVEHLEIVTLTTDEYLKTIQDAAMRGLSGGIVYDALLLACARKVGASQIFTLNVNHFRTVAPDLTDRILLP